VAIIFNKILSEEKTYEKLRWILLPLILTTFIYLSLPKVFKIEIEFKKFLIVNVRFKIFLFYVKIYHYKFPNKSNSKKTRTIKKKKRKIDKLKILIKSFFELFNLFLSVSIIKIEEVITRVYCKNIFVLSILSGIIYSIKGILLSCGQDMKIKYQGFSEGNLLDNYFKVSLKLKIFPMKILTKSKKIIKNLRGVLNYDTSN